MLFSSMPPRPSPRTTPSSPVRAIRAPAAAEASRRSCAREMPRPTVTTRPTRPPGTASGEPGTTPWPEPAPTIALYVPERRSTSSRGTLATTWGSAEPATSSRRASSASVATSARRRRARAGSPRAHAQPLVLGPRREQLRRAVDRAGHGSRHRADRGRQRSRAGQEPGPEDRSAAAAGGRLRGHHEDAGGEHDDEHRESTAGIDGGDLGAGVGSSHGA